MEYLKVVGGKGSPKREFRSSRNRSQKTIMCNLMEAIAQVNCGGGGTVVSETSEDGVVRMKIKVRKEDLRQMLQVMKDGEVDSSARRPLPSSSLSVEQRLNLLRRKHILRANNNAVKESRPAGSWSPVLQSIPEEL